MLILFILYLLLNKKEKYGGAIKRIVSIPYSDCSYNCATHFQNCMGNHALTKKECTYINPNAYFNENNRYLIDRDLCDMTYKACINKCGNTFFFRY